MLSLKKDHATVLTLGKSFFSSLNRPKAYRPCIEDVSFLWGDCLDELFYTRKGCQDPWFVNPVSLPICTNVTHILGSYNIGPAASGKDSQFWDRPYMAQRE